MLTVGQLPSAHIFTLFEGNQTYITSSVMVVHRAGHRWCLNLGTGALEEIKCGHMAYAAPTAFCHVDNWHKRPIDKGDFVR